MAEVKKIFMFYTLTPAQLCTSLLPPHVISFNVFLHLKFSARSCRDFMNINSHEMPENFDCFFRDSETYRQQMFVKHPQETCWSAHASGIKVISGAHPTRIFNLHKTEINLNSKPNGNKNKNRAQKKKKSIQSLSSLHADSDKLTPEAINIM